MNLPDGLSSEIYVWMRLQMTLAASRAADLVRAQLRETEDFSNGLFVVVGQLLPHLAREHPDLAARLAPNWRDAAARFDELEAGAPERPDEEPKGMLEARKMLYDIGVDLSLWPKETGQARRAA
ncbi:MAG: hypothetical protein Q8M35_06780 [Pseudohongiella sp.]|nr:hypothetical protein [Pseudohongiella sp.]